MHMWERDFVELAKCRKRKKQKVMKTDTSSIHLSLCKRVSDLSSISGSVSEALFTQCRWPDVNSPLSSCALHLEQPFWLWLSFCLEKTVLFKWNFAVCLYAVISSCEWTHRPLVLIGHFVEFATDHKHPCLLIIISHQKLMSNLLEQTWLIASGMSSFIDTLWRLVHVGPLWLIWFIYHWQIKIINIKS